LLIGAPAWLAQEVADDVADLPSADRHSSRKQEMAKIERGRCIPPSLSPTQDTFQRAPSSLKRIFAKLKFP
jgi:hypothetical protein